jgi:hypothetical protein
MKQFKQKLKLLLFSAISISLPILFVEFGMVVLEPWLPMGMFQYDADLGFRVRSHTKVWGAETNNFGFNDRDYELQKAPGTYRILVIGDSYNWAGGRPNNYVTLLRKKFNQRYGKGKVEVINAGYPNTQTAQQLALLKKYALQYNPDMVILGFYVGNDYLEGDPHIKRIVVNDSFINLERDKETIFLGYPVLSQSRLITFVQQKYKALTEAYLRDADGILTETAYLQVELDRIDVASLESLKTGKYKQNIDYILNSLSEMSDLLRAKNIKFMTVIIPDEYQVREKLRNDIFAKFNRKPQEYDLELPQKVVKERLGLLQVPYLDILPKFIAESKSQSLYKPRDTHWNDDGNLLAANLLFDYLLPQVDREVAKPSKIE